MILYILHAIIFSLAQPKEPSLLGVLPLNFWGDRKGRTQREVFGEKDSMQGSMMIGVYLLQLTKVQDRGTLLAVFEGFSKV